MYFVILVHFDFDYVWDIQSKSWQVFDVSRYRDVDIMVRWVFEFLTRVSKISDSFA